MDPWVEYCVGAVDSETCVKFRDVTHVTHIDSSLTILKDGIINPRLISDESSLNKDRILVNWLSPNFWVNGFRYGNVAFKYNFDELIRGKNCYWVEVMGYSVAAPRILVTEKNYSSDPRFIAYDPTARSGPWWYDQTNNLHYRNSKVTLEFMLEFTLNPADASEIEFVRHHPKFCCVDAVSCQDKNMSVNVSAGLFLVGSVLTGINCDRYNFSDSAISEISDAINGFVWGAEEAASVVEFDSNTRVSLMKAWMAAKHFRRNDEATQIIKLFPSASRFKQEMIDQIKVIGNNTILGKIP